MGEEPSKKLVIQFMEAYWRNFHAEDVGSRYYKRLMLTLQEAGDVYQMLQEWNENDNSPFEDETQDKVNNAAGTLVSEMRYSGVSGLQEIIDEWNKKAPKLPKRRHKPKDGKPSRPYYMDREDLEYGP